MTTDTASTSVTTSVVVEAPIERAFTVFTDGIDSWWNKDHHLIDDLDHMVFDTYVGGHVYDVAKDGSECRWSRVLAYEPPDRVVFSWDITLDWRVETDPARTSEVEVRFTALDPATTRVDLEHRHLDRHGEGWEAMRTAVSSGWDLGAFARAAHTA